MSFQNELESYEKIDSNKNMLSISLIDILKPNIKKKQNDNVVKMLYIAKDEPEAYLELLSVAIFHRNLEIIKLIREKYINSEIDPPSINALSFYKSILPDNPNSKLKEPKDNYIDIICPFVLMAGIGGDIEIFNYLLENGLISDINQSGVIGLTQKYKNIFNSNIIGACAYYGNDKLLEYLLRNYRSKLDINFITTEKKSKNTKINFNKELSETSTPLLACVGPASDEKTIEILKILEDYKANFDNRDFNENNIIHIAIERKKIKTIKFLVKSMKLQDKINEKNNDNITPFDIAKKMNNEEILSIFNNLGKDDENEIEENEKEFIEYSELKNNKNKKRGDKNRNNDINLLLTSSEYNNYNYNFDEEKKEEEDSNTKDNEENRKYKYNEETEEKEENKKINNKKENKEQYEKYKTQKYNNNSNNSKYQKYNMNNNNSIYNDNYNKNYKYKSNYENYNNYGKYNNYKNKYNNNYNNYKNNNNYDNYNKKNSNNIYKTSNQKGYYNNNNNNNYNNNTLNYYTKNQNNYNKNYNDNYSNQNSKSIAIEIGENISKEKKDDKIFINSKSIDFNEIDIDENQNNENSNSIKLNKKEEFEYDEGSYSDENFLSEKEEYNNKNKEYNELYKKYMDIERQCINLEKEKNAIYRYINKIYLNKKLCTKTIPNNEENINSLINIANKELENKDKLINKLKKDSIMADLSNIHNFTKEKLKEYKILYTNNLKIINEALKD